MVDDHELFRRGLIGLLEERGIEVAGEAALAADAIRLAADIGQCVVLMDLSMPGMSGIEAMQRSPPPRRWRGHWRSPFWPRIST